MRPPVLRYSTASPLRWSTASALIAVIASATPSEADAWFKRQRGDATPSAEQAAASARFEAEMDAEKAALESGVAQALAEGKAVLIFPLYGVSARAMREDRETGLSRPYSLDVELIRAGATSATGNTVNPGATGSYTLYLNEGAEPSVYTLRVVEPGTWTAAGMRVNLRGGQMPATTLKREVREGGFGKVRFAIVDLPEQVTEQHWEPPTFRTRDVSADVCVTVHVPSGNCVTWGRQVVGQVTEAVSTGGWYDVTRTLQRPGLQVTVLPSTAFASVTVAAGEVVLLDGLYFKPPGIQFLDECKQVGGQSMDCELNSYEYQIWPSSEAGFLKAVAEKSGGVFFHEHFRATRFLPSLPGTAEMLSRARHRPYTLVGKPGWADAQWGQNMYVEAGK